MEAKLVFHLPVEESEFTDAVNGTKYAIVLKGVLENIRKTLKYKEDLSKETINELEELQKNIISDINDYNINNILQC